MLLLKTLKGYSEKSILKVVLFWIQNNLRTHESSHSKYSLSDSFLNSDKMQRNIYQVTTFMILSFGI